MAEIEVENYLSSNQVSINETANTAVDQMDDMDVDISQINFEEIFFNPITQKSVWEAVATSRVTKISDDESDGDDDGKMRLRTRKPKTKEIPKTVPTVGTASSARPVVLDSPRKNSSSVPVNDFTFGCKVIDELMTRYQNSKMKYKLKNQTMSTEDLGNDSSELEELSSDGETEPNEVSNFTKTLVPQYDVKKMLCEMHYDAIMKMSLKEVGKVCKQVLPELKKIKNESLPCKRHAIFLECGISKQRLRDISVAKPFNSAHDHRVTDIIKNELYLNEDETENNGEIIYYISLVLLPEALIRIFARVNQIDYELAEKELRFGAIYDGPLPTYVLKTLENPTKKKKKKKKMMKLRAVKQK